MNIVIIGAGAVGRGLIAPSLLEQSAGHVITFIDRDDDLARSLLEGYYPIKFRMDSGVEWVGPVQSTVRQFDQGQALQRAELIFVSVRPQNLESTIPILRESRCPVIVVENTPNAAGLLNGWLQSQRCTNGIAECIIPPSPYTDVDPTFTYGDADGFIVLERMFGLTHSKRIVHSSNFQLDWLLKWYFHCGLHAVIAYVGLGLGLKYIDEVVNNSLRFEQLTELFENLATSLSEETGFNKVYFIDRLGKELYKLSEPAIRDTCARVGRDPMRKLQRGERLMMIQDRVEKFQILSFAIDTARGLL